MMIALLMLVQSASPAPSALPPGAILDAQARRGVLMRLDGAAAHSVEACISACDLTPNCQAWTYHQAETARAARCDLHPIAGPSHFDPGAITGLSPALAARIVRPACVNAARSRQKPLPKRRPEAKSWRAVRKYN